MSSDTRAALEVALRAALEYLSSLDERPVNATASADELRRRLRKPLPDRGLAAARTAIGTSRRAAEASPTAADLHRT